MTGAADIMPVFKHRSVISGITVKEAMQKQVVQLPIDTPVTQCVRTIIKFKANAVMVTGPDQTPAGVISKTDIIGAFYAGLSLGTPISDIMVAPPLFCEVQDTLETAIDQMQKNSIHQIYVRSEKKNHVVGQVAYSDIVGLLYRYCRACIRSGRCLTDMETKEIPRLMVKDVMTSGANVCRASDPITQVIEILSGRKLGAVLVSDHSNPTLGIISKTDLVLSYIRGIPLDEPAGSIMNTPVAICLVDTLLSDAIQKMFLFDIHRIFVKKTDKGPVMGVLSLSDATRFRSGTCRACAAARILDNS
ncbi:MAG: CBS domain-containing protein [Pseudomonadota bacterium]